MEFPCSAAAAAGLVVAMLAAVPVQAQTNAPGTQTLEPVIITGSNVPRIDMETVAPVEIITREQIERSTAQSVAEFLVKLPYIGSASFIEAANSGTEAASSISLRALGTDATLVLLNGRRTSGYGIAQNITDTFIDLNAIPVAAIDRIEILKDGASAIYGADAIAGVINIILRRDYKGIEAAANVGFFEGKNDYRATFLAGMGDPGTDGYNVFAILDYYKRDGLTMADTEFGRTRDQRWRQGGRNFQSLTGGGTWQGSGAAGSVAANTRRAYAECDTKVDYAGVVSLGLVPVNQSNLALGSGINQPGNTWCVRDFANHFTINPEVERIGFLGRGTIDFNPSVQGYAELGLSRNTATSVFQEPSIANSIRFYPAPPPAQLAYTRFNVILAPGAAGNPLPFNATYAGVLNDFGLRGGTSTSDALRLLAGLKYSFRGWEFDSAVVYAKSQVTNDGIGQLAAGTLAAFGVPDTPQPPTPVATSTLYNLDRPSTNEAEVRDSMVSRGTHDTKSDLKMFDTRATTEVGALPGGPIGVAFGVEYRAESMDDYASPEDVSRLLNVGVWSVQSSRTNFAVYGELALPFTRQLEGQAALRYDRYSDMGAAITPKLGLKFKPVPAWLMRMTWGRGFKAPTLPEVTASLSFIPTTITDPVTGSSSAVVASLGGNPNLEPEKSRTFTAGVIFEPGASFSVGIDVYQIKWSNQVAFEDIQTVANNPDDPRVFRDPTTGLIRSITTTYINLSEISTQGVDVDVRYRTSTAYGRLGTRLAANYVASYEVEGTEYAGTNGAWLVSNASAVPRWKGQWSFDWEKGPWTAQLMVNYMHHYWRVYGMTVSPSFYRPGAATAIPQTGQLDPKSPSYTTVDLYARYSVTPKFSVSGSVVNLTDEMPPFDPSYSQTYFHDRGTGYDVRGRIYRLAAQYKF